MRLQIDTGSTLNAVLTLSLPCMSTASQHQCVLQGTMSVDQG